MDQCIFDPDSTKHGQAGWIENIDCEFPLYLNAGSWHTNIMIICENLNTANLVEILLFLTDNLQIY